MPAQETLKPTKLTEALVRSLEPADKPYTVRDTAVKGLMLAVNKKASRTRCNVTFGLAIMVVAGSLKPFGEPWERRTN